LSAAGASIGWDDSAFYVPSVCTSYTFNYTASNKVLIAQIKITNRFNDEIASAMFFGPGSGKVSLQVCTGADFSGTKVVLEVSGSLTNGGSDDIVSTPITFLPRTGSPTSTPAPAPTVTVTATPAPAPTVTVTATPAPAPTVTVTATPAPAPTVTVTATPAPAPTVTVTATPAPAPTVYLTNPSDKNLSDLVASLKSQISLLNAKSEEDLLS
jgi:hypothetical protein